MRERLLLLMGLMLLVSCSGDKNAGDELNLMSKFDNTWNIY